MSSWLATVLERISAMPGAVLSSTAAAASSHDDSIPRISIAVSPKEAVETQAAAERDLRRARPAGRLPQAQLDRDRWAPRAPSRKRAGMRTGAGCRRARAGFPGLRAAR